MKTRMNWLALVLAACSAAPALAQQVSAGTAASELVQHHGSELASTSSAKDDVMPASMSGMDHGSMHSAPVAMSGMTHAIDVKSGGAAEMAGMDHGNMQTQGNSAPADARDPHAYSDGITLGTGAYVLAGPRQIKMADEHNFASLLLNRFERAYGNDSNSTAYDAQAWFGKDYDRLVIKAEGDVAQGKLQDSRTELLWGHAITPFWDAQMGLRYDDGSGPGRSWLAIGVQGLTPYWFDVNATAYVGNNGRTALRLGAEYEILLTQKLFLQPSLEINMYGKRDAARDIGSGFSSGVAGLRLRYEINRQIAPYIGVERSSKFGETADLTRVAGERSAETRWVAGVRFWF
ncbi:MAG: copper resistance protein B [bacterium]